MKMTSKVFTGLLVVVLVFAMAGCGGSAPEELAGKWNLTGMEVMGQTLSMDEVSAMGVSADIYFDFKDGKKVEVSATGGGTSAAETINYTYENSTVTISQQGTEISLELQDDTLRWDMGSGVLLFKR